MAIDAALSNLEINPGHVSSVVQPKIVRRRKQGHQQQTLGPTSPPSLQFRFVKQEHIEDGTRDTHSVTTAGLLRSYPRSSLLESTRELYNYLLSCPALAPPISIFKGGGYVYSDAENLLKASRLCHVFQMTNKIAAADAVVCRAQWDDKRTVDLKGHQNAASNHGVPFIVVDRFTPGQLLHHLRPLLEARGIVPPLQRQLLHRIVAWDDSNQGSGSISDAAGSPLGMGPAPFEVTGSVLTPQLQQMQMQVMAGDISMGHYIRAAMNYPSDQLNLVE